MFQTATLKKELTGRTQTAESLDPTNNTSQKVTGICVPVNNSL
jgi:hypothetical protein